MLYQQAATTNKDLLLKNLQSSTNGLSETEITSRRATQGLNKLSVHTAEPLSIFLSQFKSSFVYLLIIASIISFALGENIDAFIILSFITLNTFLGFFQEYRASISLEKLRKFITKNTNVKRDGQVKTINDEELVVGDIVILKAGDLIPAEIRFISGNNLQVDESILTGESAPVTKITDSIKNEPKSINEAQNIGFSGTLLTTGEAEAIVLATGNQTELGLISKLTLETETESGFSKEIKKISKAIIWIMAGTITLIFILHLLFRSANINIFDLAIFSVALAVGVIPEALPLVITISLSKGALKLAHKKVVPKRLSAIEDLGSIDLLCTDKTGTITENKLAITETYSSDKESEENKRLLQLAYLTASLSKEVKEPTDPFDIAIWEKLNERERKVIQNFKKIDELPFDPVRRRSSVIVEENEKEILIVRGAYEEIRELCTNKGEIKADKWIKDIGGQGKRILAVAIKEVNFKTIENIKKEENNLKFEGLIAFHDPLKKTAEIAIKEAKALGVNIKILTGDSPEVAAIVGKETGLIKTAEEVITGRAYEALTYEQKEKALEKIVIFARVTPEQKFEIIKGLQEKHMVGYLGEGFNDAPALKVAHVGLVVDNAADVAKEAADVILLSKDLKTIIDGIKEGRKTFTNTVKYICVTLTSNFGNFFALAFSSLAIPFLPMLPVQILLVNILTDLPMISISTDNVEAKSLSKPKKYMISSMITLGIILGLISTCFDFATFFYFVRFGEKSLQTLWFTESVLTELLILFSIRTAKYFIKAARPSNLILGLTAITFITTLLIPFTRIGQNLFGFIKPTWSQLSTVLGLVLFYFVVSEAIKLMYYKFQKAE